MKRKLTQKQLELYIDAKTWAKSEEGQQSILKAIDAANRTYARLENCHIKQ